jgi:UDP-2,4-diacetamido-2,4,6-trideoxy-beta-L-altropyranose hydrolase
MTEVPMLIRADASISIGTGHVMRCLALAQAWYDAGGTAAFAMAESTPAIAEKLRAESCVEISLSEPAGSAGDAEETIACASRLKSKWIVVDGYRFGPDYQKFLKAAGFRVLFLDDYGHSTHFAADFVLNQNVSASVTLYSAREAGTRLLLGPKYALLRREFIPWRDWVRSVSSECRKVLVMMGGSDPENLTGLVIDALQLAKLENLETTIVVGGSNPNFPELRRAAAQSGNGMTVLRDISNAAELMATADVAVSAAGSTCWELCLMGLPALLIDVAVNQTQVAEELQRRGCAIHVGDRSVTKERLAEALMSLSGSEECRRSLSQRSRALVDGKGAERVVSVLRGEACLRLRRAVAEDRQRLWEWANDSDVRAASFLTAPIPWEAHVHWFSDKLADKNSLIFIAEAEQGTPVGQIRFNIDGREAEVNISLAKGQRGRGLAVPAVQAAVRQLFAEVDCNIVHAFVKPENIASAKVFEKAGFVPSGSKTVRGCLALHFVCTRSQ